MRIALTLLAIVGLISGAVAYVLLSEPAVTEQTLLDAEAAAAAGDQEMAMRLVGRYLAHNPKSGAGLRTLGSIHLLAGETEDAYARLTESLASEPDSIETNSMASTAAMTLGRLADVERHLQAVQRLDPGHYETNRALFDIYRLQSRYEELPPHFMGLINQQQITVAQLLVMAVPDLRTLRKSDEMLINSCRTAAPDDLLPMLGVARRMLAASEVIEAKALLQQICQQHPSILTAQALLGQALTADGSEAELRHWIDNLSDNAAENSAIWLVRGELAARSGQPQQAARCFWEGLNRNPINRECAYRLGTALAGQPGHEDSALRFLKHANELAALRETANEAGPASPQKMREVVDGMVRFGRTWEAAGWAYVSMQIPSERSWAEPETRRLFTELKSQPPFIRPEANLAKTLDLSAWPVPTMESLVQPNRPESGPAKFELQFANQASQLGLDFQFNIGEAPTPKVFQLSGGGASVIDFDRDGWPDVYLTQGADWPVTHAVGTESDQIFRNVGGEGFENVSVKSIVGDTGYGQGAAVGDVNNDGFPDIFVGNVGTNTLYYNNGDGTFSVAEPDASLASDAWTIGAMIADLSGDGAPDVYAVNYLGGDDLHTRECVSGGRLIQCGPDLFPAAADQFLQSRGDGSFELATDNRGLAADDGKGMGVVAFRVPESDSLGVFVSNDMTPNHLFVSDQNRFVEQALVGGVALGARGRRQSCMGVASGDVDNDGRMDFFVTNFVKEANNLYLQKSSGAFEDQIESSGLSDAGYFHMGWGAQFLDANLDGNLDLIVANGHLEDRRPSRSQMPTQVFQNLGKGRFVAGEAVSIGPYFEKDYFGRAVATIDWNRDGLPDAIVTHRGSPVALLTNTAASHGDSVRVRLAGVNSSRDAVSAVLTLQTDTRKLTRQVTAGDGFQASSQREILFGITAGERIKSLTVDWPAGSSVTIEDVQKNSVLHLVEGESRLVPLPR